MTSDTKQLMLRELTQKERPVALSLAWKVFSEYESPVYSREGTEEFRKCLKDEAYLNGIRYYGAFDGKHLAGVLGIRDATRHICFFFVDGAYQRLGIGTRLFRRMQEDYPGQSVTLNASPYGVPFYLSLGFRQTDTEQTVNGIRFTPMLLRGENTDYQIVRLTERRDLKENAALWFSSKWRVPTEAYLESIEESFSADVPCWYVCLDGGKIIAGMGVIENDFHDRKDLSPNVCAVYTEPQYRKQRICPRLLSFVTEDMASKGYDTLYLITDHTGLYERYGWEYYCMAQGEGDEKPSRLYVHYQKEPQE